MPAGAGFFGLVSCSCLFRASEIGVTPIGRIENFMMGRPEKKL